MAWALLRAPCMNRERNPWIRQSVRPLVFPLVLTLGVGLLVGRWTAADAVAPAWARQIHQAALLELDQMGGEDLVGPCQVTRVVDGDRVDVACGGEQSRVRLLQIDAPERGEPRHWEAAGALWTLVDGEELYLAFEEPGQPAANRYGRVLAYLVDEDGRNLNVEMVRRGWSRFWRTDGGGRFQFSFAEAEFEAQRSGRGLWSR